MMRQPVDPSRWLKLRDCLTPEERPESATEIPLGAPAVGAYRAGWSPVARWRGTAVDGASCVVELRDAWDDMVLRQHLVDHVAADGRPRRGAAADRLILLYACEERVGLGSMRRNSVPPRLIVGPWREVHQVYVPQPLVRSGASATGPALPRLEAPLLSLITVVLNGAATLEQTVQSVLPWCGTSVEYLVIDGASTDGTVGIIRRYEGDAIRWVSELDAGIYDGMNRGWRLARGHFVGFLGGDDILLDLPLEALRATRERGSDLVYGDVRLSDGRRFRSRYGAGLRFDNTLHHQGLFTRRGLSAEGPFDLRFRTFADFDLNQRLYRRGARAAAADTVVAYFRVSGASGRGSRAELLDVVRQNFGGAAVVLARLGGKLRGARARLRRLARRRG